MKKNKFVILSVCLAIGLCSCTLLNDTEIPEYQPQIQTRTNLDNYQYTLDIDNGLNVEIKNDAFITKISKNADVLKAEEDEEIEDELEEDENTEEEDDPNIPFQAGRFEWWWIVVIVGTIALIFFIAWLIFFIWDRKDKKKYKKKQ